MVLWTFSLSSALGAGTSINRVLKWHELVLYAISTTFVGAFLSVLLEKFENHLRAKTEKEVEMAQKYHYKMYSPPAFRSAIIQFSDLLQASGRKKGVGMKMGRRWNVVWCSGGGG